ncbi:hypothetical protein AMATHDRAFT_74358 [Amanita thiersii Skay4041]|uniref:Mediator of RNA polymerase II transcription subunit 11 n=1 Tax=Amanita thiersii Skay4041 TaxID=703135 RepID=A0A2A9NWZ1_9AGAR|nr:hypothetical protein AMATHDRAFT_74358 [Amanita thiersii Skay4041]
MHPPAENDAIRDASRIDPIWTTSRTARQIYALGEVEKVSEDNLPLGEERSEQFVLEVSEYFERLDAIQVALRSTLAHIRHSRIAPSAINAPPMNFVPPSLGVGLSSAASEQDSSTAGHQTDLNRRRNRGLQEERAERNAWNGILDALARIKALRGEEMAMDSA